MELYIAYCCREKRPGLNSPDNMYLSGNRIQPFILRCKERKLPRAIFSAKYGLFFPWERKPDYDLTFRPVWGYFLGVGVAENGRILSQEESEARVKGLARQIKEDVGRYQIDRFHFVLHYAVDGCETVPQDRRELAEHVLRESLRISLFSSIYDI